MKFVKMHGLGNDFVIVDARGQRDQDFSQLAILLGDRRRGVGYDQLAVILESESCDAGVRFWNCDGSESATCGNATRCVARLLSEERCQAQVVLETPRGHLTCESVGDGRFRVNMGHPEFAWQDIPLATASDTLHLPLENNPTALSLGNPHCIFFVQDIDLVQLEDVGPRIERHALFPERTNVEFVEVKSDGRLRLRIWERGTGITLASGSGACAAAVAANRRGLAARCVPVETDGGILEIDWRESGVWKTGPTAFVFEGILSAELGVEL